MHMYLCTSSTCASPAKRGGEEVVEQAVVVLDELGRDAELAVGLGVKIVLVELEHTGFEHVIFGFHEVGVRSTRTSASVPRIAAAEVSWRRGRGKGCGCRRTASGSG